MSKKLEIDANNKDVSEEDSLTDNSVSSLAKRNFRPTQYPRSGRKLSLEATPLGLKGALSNQLTSDGQTVTVSTDGIEFRTCQQYEEGSLIRLEVDIPNFWDLKKGLVEYQRLDAPTKFRVLGRVIRSEEVSKRGKRNLVTVETLVIDDVDKQALFTYLKD